MRSLKDESGQTLVVAALCMTILLGFVALAVDVGFVFHARRNMQIAADAGAVAGGLDYKYNSSTTSAKTAACAAAAANGVSGSCVANSSCMGVTTTTICVNDPPLNGYHKSTGYTEVIVNEPVPTLFMKILNISSIDVPARAVAGTGANNGCMWALSLSGTDVSLSGTGSINAPNCDIYDDSNASNALSLSGVGSITAKAIGIVGGYSDTGTGHITPNPPTTGIAPAADPLSLTPPTISTGTCSSNCVMTNSGTSNVTVTLTPGTYTSITNSGTGNLTVNTSSSTGSYIITGDVVSKGTGTLTLGPGNWTIGGNLTNSGTGAVSLGAGLYIVEGNLTLTGTGSQTGTSVTFYVEGSNTITGTGNTTLTAPTSGPYDGVVIYEPSSDTQKLALSGTGGDNLQGIVYAPGAPLSLSGTGSMSVSLDLIVDTITLSGTGSITDTNYATVTNPNSVLSKLVMVE